YSARYALARTRDNGRCRPASRWRRSRHTLRPVCSVGSFGATRSRASDPGRRIRQPRAVPWRAATLGDNGRQYATMTADDQTGPAEPSPQLLQRSRHSLRRIAHRALWTVARPYARRRDRAAEMVG